MCQLFCLATYPFYQPAAAKERAVLSLHCAGWMGPGVHVLQQLDGDFRIDRGRLQLRRGWLTAPLGAAHPLPPIIRSPLSLFAH